jgi:UDP-glucose 4-epimerase
VKRVLITGGAGFIGYHLGKRLAEADYEVDLIDNFTRGVADKELLRLVEDGAVRLVTADLLRPDALGNLEGSYTHVVHLAAIVGVRNVVANPYRVLVDNLAMQRNALEWAKRQPELERFIFLSTSEVYAGTQAGPGVPIPTPEAVDLTMRDLDRPRTSYALSKIAGEALCHYAGIPFTILRPHNVYGPRMGLDHVVPELLQRAYAAPDGGKLEVYSVDHRRTFCFVDDAAEIIHLVLDQPHAEGVTLNLGAAEPEVSIGELALLVARTVGKRLEIVALPPTPGSPARRCPDVGASVALLGFQPRIDLDEGLQRTFAWYRENVFNRADAARA